jgi:Asp-tRNA(Asn)/Glu-tRNA(Gln) amidotransferase A subunit family amidase
MSGFSDYEQYDALGLAELVRRRKVTPVELLDAAIERVEARNRAVNKDLTASLAGVRTTRGSRFFADTPPATADSEHVRRLKQAGLVIFGRTNTCELGLSLTCEPQLYGPTRSPWDLSRISGGSSGGAAAAVGARMLPMAHATDGFGSIRAPAACCGLVGLKPTRARHSRWPARLAAFPWPSSSPGAMATRPCSSGWRPSSSPPGPGSRGSRRPQDERSAAGIPPGGGRATLLDYGRFPRFARMRG